jgi:hypothetical protein
MATTTQPPTSPLEIARGAVLADRGSLLAQVEEIRDCYLMRTGRSLGWSLAIWCLDQIRAERGSR